jgi:uncharacterized protein (AIM24 family)
MATDMLSDEDRLIEQLQRASEHLRADHLDAAEQAIAAALSIKKEDLRARNLHGLYLFRAGRHAEALEVYLALAVVHPDDAALRLNLGLVQLRMGKNAEAAENLEHVIAAEPDNQRAQGYLGLALMRSGELRRAREAFAKAGQPDLERQVAERLDQEAADNSARSELKRAAVAGDKALDGEQPFTPVELEPQGELSRGSWQVRVPGERTPLPGPEGFERRRYDPLSLEPPMPVAAFATTRLLRAGGLGEPFAMAEGGVLVVRVDGRLPTRTLGAIASTGQLVFEPLHRRVRGQGTEEPFGEGADAMFLARGHGLIVVAPRGARFHALALAEDIVYLREARVFAFEEGLHWENGRVPGADGDALRVVQFRGNGRLVVRTGRALFSLKIEADTSLFVDASTLVGWIGRIVPRVMRSDDGEPTPYVECSGEGVLLLEEPAAS